MNNDPVIKYVSGYTTYSDSDSVNFFTFPDGTRHVKIDSNLSNHVLLCAKPDNADGLVDVLLAADALRRMEQCERIDLILPYMHGSRQDRVCVKGEPLSAKVYADIINLGKFDHVYVYDPHSDVMPALINNCVVLDSIGVEAVLEMKHVYNTGNIVLIAPDAGAIKRVWKIAQAFGIEIIECSKIRDLNTGKILKFQVNGDVATIKDKHLLIIDDICTNGGTFLGLADELDRYDPVSINLCVTHADHAKGITKMCERFDEVWISNSRDLEWEDIPENLTIINLTIINLSGPIV